MRGCRTGPTVRPRAIVEIKTSLTAIVVKGGIDGERAGVWIEFQHEQSIFSVTCNRQPMCAGVRAGPMRENGCVKNDAGNFDRVSTVLDVDYHDPVQNRHALDQVVRDDTRYAAEGARKLPDQLRS